jgi:hypothetical protein
MEINKDKTPINWHTIEHQKEKLIDKVMNNYFW